VKGKVPFFLLKEYNLEKGHSIDLVCRWLPSTMKEGVLSHLMPLLGY